MEKESSGSKNPSVLVSDADIEYYCNCYYPFIQLVNASAVFSEELPLVFVTASTGWIIHDYGEAISVASPHTTQQKKNTCNILAQAKIAEEIIKLVGAKNWSSIEIIAGTQAMKRLMWIEAKRVKLDVAGYTSSPSDEKCYSHLAKHFKNMGVVWEYPLTRKIQPKEGVTTAK